MSNRCSDTSQCPDGNCVGCKNGSLFCNDPRCYPNCPDCTNDSDESNNNADRIILIILLILAGILLILFIIAGIDYWNKTSEATEPKSITVHKHVNQVMSPPVISSPSYVPDYSRPASCPKSTFEDFTLKSPCSENTSSCGNSVQIEGYE